MRYSILCCLIWLFFTQPATARYRPMTGAELKAGSDVIALVEVTKVQKVKLKVDHWGYRQKSEIQPITVLKGNLPAGSTVLRESSFACDTEGLVLGGRYLLFLKKTSEGPFVSTNYGNGVFPLTGDSLSFFPTLSDRSRVSSKLSTVIKLLR